MFLRTKYFSLTSITMLMLVTIFVRSNVVAQNTGVITRVSVSSNNMQGNGDARDVDISPDGRFIAFVSKSSNLIDDDQNGETEDVFLHDRMTSQTSLLSISSDGTQGNAASIKPSVSENGRYVVFESLANNLVANDTNSASDIFVHDLITGHTQRVSQSSLGAQANNTSAQPSISANGRFVVFTSAADNLTGKIAESFAIYLHDTETGRTEQISVSNDGLMLNNRSFLPSVSDDGQIVVFQSLANNLVEGDSNATGYEVFVFNRGTNQTQLVSVSSEGVQGNGESVEPEISADGRYVVFASNATNLTADNVNGLFLSIFSHDLRSKQTRLVSVNKHGQPANGWSLRASISSNGQFVLFYSDATDLAENDLVNQHNLDVFVRDLDANSTELVSTPGDSNTHVCGGRFGSVSAEAAISANGLISTFLCYDRLLESDTNSKIDVYVHDIGGTAHPIITGKIQSWNVNDEVFIPVQGATVSAGGFTTISQADGTYSLEVEAGKNYTLQPRLTEGDLFWPQETQAESGDSEVDFIYLGSEDDDADGDAIPNGWEINGRTVEEDGKTYFLDLPSMGASPIHKDMFVEVDWMEVHPSSCGLFSCVGGYSFKPEAESLQKVVEVYASSPILNPDGAHGVRVVFDYGQESWAGQAQGEAVPYREWFMSPNQKWSFELTENTFRILQETWSSLTSRHFFSLERRGVFHYVLFADKIGGRAEDACGVTNPVQAGGLASFLGANTIITPGRDSDVMTEAGLVLHEIGHLGLLGHGGHIPETGELDSENFKSNYPSAMNYFFQSGLTRVANGVATVYLDYSRHDELLPLDESSLDENVAMSSIPELNNVESWYFCPIDGVQTKKKISSFGSVVDWNCSIPGERVVSSNINATQAQVVLDICGRKTPHTTLQPRNDWKNITIGARLSQSLQPVSQLVTSSSHDADEFPESDWTDSLAIQSYAMSFSGDTQIYALPGTSIALPITLTNTGLAALTISVKQDISGTWFSEVSYQDVLLMPGDRLTNTVLVEIPASVTVNSIEEFQLSATARNVNGLIDILQVSVQVVSKDQIEELRPVTTRHIFLPIVTR